MAFGFSIAHRVEGDVVVLVLEGRLDTSASAIFDQYIKKLLGEGFRRFVLNFDLVDYLSSNGMRVILSLAKYLKSHQGALALSLLQEQVFDLIRMAGFDTILTITPTEELACNAVRA